LISTPPPLAPAPEKPFRRRIAIPSLLAQKTRWIKTPKGKILELTMQVGHTPELEGRVLRWGSDVRVLEPKSLKDAIKRQARGIVDGW
jgi:predicted DNA-binding transcriptional regulator YafY